MKLIIANNWLDSPAPVIWSPAPPFDVKSIAVQPAKANQTKHMIDGTIFTFKTSSRIVRLLEIRARNKPTDGANSMQYQIPVNKLDSANIFKSQDQIYLAFLPKKIAPA